ncbi:Helix-turn-helix domain-containing protein [Halopelagius inordinatus]|uniref:Helix-turn-helix domain-containing protein n=1 Tax=Halopelagius inordinatus TaxID=553467 RepID=A0A1I2LNW9_9EURY|nr:winged helix-turn-helix domain-containing protein [Halopelagius inordinatus]SFF80955.1 Helix-turn-helix domain-containing protein [Halopelagius inordinatus]
MADILPSRPDLSDEDKEPRVVGIDSEDAEDLLSAISSDTARSILAELHEEPATPSEVADRADTSIQNAQYHLGKLGDTGLVEEAGTAYSEKGREMTVYAPADRALVVVAGQEDDTSGLQTALSQLLGGLGVVAVGSVVVDRLARYGGVSQSVGLGEGGSDGLETAGDTETSAGDSGAATRTETATDASAGTATEGDGGFHIAEATETPEETRTEAARTVRETAEATPKPTEVATAAPTQTPHSTPTPAPELEQTTRAVAESGGTASDPLTTLGTAVASLSPGELFFLGGLAAVLAVGAYWWLRS